VVAVGRQSLISRRKSLRRGQPARRVGAPSSAALQPKACVGGIPIVFAQPAVAERAPICAIQGRDHFVVKTQLRRFEIVTYKDKSGTDSAQVPTAATVNFYPPGATALVAATLHDTDPDPTDVTVDYTGNFSIGEHLGVNAGLSRLIISAIPSGTVLSLSATAPTVTIAIGDLLSSRDTARPVAYSDPLGHTSLGSTVTAVAATGRVGCYLREKRFAYVVSGTVSPARAYPNWEGASFPETPYYNARDYSTLQAGIDAMAGMGGTLYIPAGVYNATSTPSYTPPLTLPDSTIPYHIVGDGANLTTLEANASSADMLLVRADHSHVSGLTLIGSAQTGSGRGIVVGPGSTRVAGGFSISDCEIYNTASWGLYVIGGDPNNGPFSIQADYQRVRIYGARSNGSIYVGPGNTTQYFTNCAAVGFVGYGVDVLQSGGNSFLRCTFEDSRNPDSDLPYVRFRKTFATVINECWFEHHELPFGTERYFISLGEDDANYFSGNITIDTCSFNQRVKPSAHIVQVWNSCQGIHIRNPRVAVPPPTSTEDIKIGQNCTVMIEGGEIASDTYYELQISEGLGSKVYYFARHRLRVPKLSTPERDALTQAGAGDTIQNATTRQAQIYEGSNWGAITTFQSASRLHLTGPVLEAALVVSPIAGLYRVTAMVFCTAIVSSVTVKVTIKWGDENGSQSPDLVSADLGVLGPTEASIVIRAIPGGATPNITYLTTKSASGGEYSLYVCAERLSSDADSL
jgi:hypothetical protein